MYEKLKKAIDETIKEAFDKYEKTNDAVISQGIETVKRSMIGRHMGMPKEIKDGDVSFARVFRWTFEPGGEDTYITKFATKVNLNLKTREIEVHLYDALVKNTSPTAQWIDDLIQGKREDIVVLRGWGGCGNEIFNYVFDDAEITDHYVWFDYGKSDALVHCVRLKFSKYKRTNAPNGSA